MSATQKIFETAARMDRTGVAVTRLGLIVVLLWIGGLKIFHYEADGIVPFVANSPFMKFFYAYPAPEYKKHMNKEGELVAANREWHEKNHTYIFAYGLGSVIVLYGLVALPASLAAAIRDSRQLSGVHHVVCDALLPDHLARMLGPRAGQHGARFPAALRGRAARRQRRHHDGGRPGHDGRLG